MWWFSRWVVSDSCNPMNCSPPGSSVHEIFQARLLECIAISFSRVSSQPRNWTQVSCIHGRFFTDWATNNHSVKEWRLRNDDYIMLSEKWINSYNQYNPKFYKTIKIEREKIQKYWIYFIFFGCTSWHAGSYFLIGDRTFAFWQWKHGWPGNFQNY